MPSPPHWILLDTNTWTLIHDGDRVRGETRQRLLSRMRSGALGSFFLIPAIEQELYGVVLREGCNRFRTMMRLVDSICQGRLLRNRDELLTREVLRGGALDEGERFMSVEETRRRPVAHRSDAWLRARAAEIAGWKERDRERHKGLDVNDVQRELDDRALGWRGIVHGDVAEMFASAEAMGSIEETERSLKRSAADSLLVRPVEPRAFPTAYWAARVWITRAARVLAKERSKQKPGSYDHHIVATASAYAHAFVTDDQDVMNKLVPELCTAVPRPACRFVRFSEWVEQVTE